METIKAYTVTNIAALIPGDKVKVITPDVLRFDHYCRSNNTLYFVDSANRIVTHPYNEHDYVLIEQHDVFTVGEEVIVYNESNEPIETRAFIVGWNNLEQMYYVAIAHEDDMPIITLINTHKLRHKEN